MNEEMPINVPANDNEETPNRVDKLFSELLNYVAHNVNEGGSISEMQSMTDFEKSFLETFLREKSITQDSTDAKIIDLWNINIESLTNEIIPQYGDSMTQELKNYLEKFSSEFIELP